MASETPDFQAYCGSEKPRFQNDVEVECAKLLDYYRVPWEYEPRTFVLEQAEDGTVIEAFRPDFYLPEQDLYLEVTVMKQSLVTRKNRKLRKLRELYPDVKVKLFYKRDIQRLAERYRLDLAVSGDCPHLGRRSFQTDAGQSPAPEVGIAGNASDRRSPAAR